MSNKDTTERQRPSPVQLLHEMGPKVVEKLKELGLWRCHVMSPYCDAAPFASVRRTGMNGPEDRSYGLFCRKHAEWAAHKSGHDVEFHLACERADYGS